MRYFVNKCAVLLVSRHFYSARGHW